MMAPFEPLLLQRERSEGRFGRRIRYLPRIDSTNDRALALMEAGEPEGTLVLAEEQTRGRGRRGRSWHSPAGLSIYASLILRPSLPSEQLPLVSLTAAVGSARVLLSHSLLRVSLKWPNDILLGGKKVGGLLSEARGDGRGTGVVVGLGLNVNHEEKDFPKELQGRITSVLLESGRLWDRQHLLSEILIRWEQEYEKLLSVGPRDLLEGFECFSEFKDGSRLRIDQGGESVCGHYAGLGPRGELLLRTADDSVQSFSFGDVGRVSEG
ncbi:MAG TPA: biotin--[acetyl-CoA-carboxylase] ligase [Candidatus Polarisedimenticolia bacterium]|nr:biotin--[acetyl-CoA-carboxylase] ligase [Candidatus Polarisedimenticolia bacterium]